MTRFRTSSIIYIMLYNILGGRLQLIAIPLDVPFVLTSFVIRTATWCCRDLKMFLSKMSHGPLYLNECVYFPKLSTFLSIWMNFAGRKIIKWTCGGEPKKWHRYTNCTCLHCPLVAKVRQRPPAITFLPWRELKTQHTNSYFTVKNWNQKQDFIKEA